MPNKPIPARPADACALDERAKLTGSSRSVPVAVRGDLDVNQRRVALIRERVALADHGVFACRERVKAAFARWGVDVDVD